MNTIPSPSVSDIAVEEHPLRPFLPPHARLLMLGSFPPQKKRWCMEFYYPNIINDMWRIMGYLFYEDRNHFVDLSRKCFSKEDIERFLCEKGIALYDTATAVRRLQDNASDKYLEVVTPTDLHRLLGCIPECTAIVTSGQKATDTLCETFSIEQPSVGNYSAFTAEGRDLRLYRMPSSSRAYPMKLEKKAVFYRRMMEDIGLLP
ncbi:MAG: uracil-DNA glycosylase family protein [Paraprevotella sp.]|nr:uracil-DNA glycosylase family protein [Paraprevotella sp.]